MPKYPFDLHTPPISPKRRRLQNRRTKVNYFGRLSDEAVALLVECADGNPRRLLEYADLLFDFHHRKFGALNPVVVKPDYVVTYWGAKEILALHKVNVAAYEEKRRAGAAAKLPARAGSLSKLFSAEELPLVKLLMTGPKSLPDIMGYFNWPEKAARAKNRGKREIASASDASSVATTVSGTGTPASATRRWKLALSCRRASLSKFPA